MATAHPSIPLIRIGENGEQSRHVLSLADVKRRSRLSSRDLVSALDLGFEAEGGQPQYRLVPRRRCIVFSLSHLRGILFSDEIHLWLPQSTSPDAQRKRRAVASFARGLAKLAAERKAQRAAADAHGEAPPAGVTPRAGPLGGVPHTAADSMTSDPQLPFELLAMDQLLLATHARHARRLAFITPLLQNLLESLDSEPDRLYTLYPLRNTLEHFRAAASDVVQCVSDVVASDRDMREACLTEKRRAFSDAFPGHSPAGAEPGAGELPHAPRKVLRGWGPGKATSVEAGSPTVVLERVTEESLLNLEVLLEVHVRSAARVLQGAQQLLRHLDTRTTLLGATQDALRNHLIEVNLRMTIIGLGVSFGTLASGLFGMNLYNGLEDLKTTTPFFVVGGLCAVVAAATYYGVRDWTVLSSPAGRHTRRVGQFVSTIGMRAPRPVVSAIGALLRQSAAHAKPLVVSATGGAAGTAPQLRLTRNQFARLYLEVTGTRLPEESVEIVYGIFDADQDGALGMDEVLGMMTASGHIDERALQALADLPPDEDEDGAEWPARP